LLADPAADGERRHLSLLEAEARPEVQVLKDSGLRQAGAAQQALEFAAVALHPIADCSAVLMASPCSSAAKIRPSSSIGCGRLLNFIYSNIIE
jgi:hypothetical protein